MPSAKFANAPDLTRELNRWHSAAIVIGVIIGSGIFLVPKRMMEATGSSQVVILAWVVGGLLTWFGALTYAELGAMKPGAGGEYVYVRDAYGGMMGFLYAWTWFLLGKPASIATVAAGVVRIMGQFSTFEFLKGELVSAPVKITYGHLIAATFIILLSYLNYLGVKKAGDFQLFFTILKVLMIIAIIGIGFSFAGGTFSNFSTTYEGARGGFAGFMAALIAALWAYDGWNNLNMVAGEIKNPEKNIPFALIFGIGVVAALYMLTNAAVQYVLPSNMVATAERPASLAISQVLGPLGGAIISAGIGFSMFVTINGQVLAGSRIPFAAARDGYFFESVARVSPKYHTPGVALAFQAALTILLLIVGGGFEALFNLAILSEWVFYMIAASSIFVFRKREPDLPRPYKTFGYPVVPALFILAAFVVLYFTFKEGLASPLVAGVQPSLLNSLSGGGVLLILSGIPAFYFFRWYNSRNA